jgi:hypothetical protein
MSIIYKLIGLLPFIVLTGCQSLNAPTQIPPTGSIIELTQPISVYPGYSRSFIQSGKAVKSAELNRRYPWCQFRLYEPPAALETERSIQPDRFVVTNSYKMYESVAAIPTQITSTMLFPNIMENDGPSAQDLSTIMKIESSAQPQVVEFKCSIFTDPVANKFLTINEMRSALGNVVKIHLPLQSRE